MSSRIAPCKTFQNQFLHKAKGKRKERVTNLLNRNNGFELWRKSSVFEASFYILAKLNY